MKYIEGCTTLPDWLENFIQYFISQFSRSQGRWNNFLATFLVLSSCYFYTFNPDLIVYFVKIIRNDQWLDVVLMLPTRNWKYKNKNVSNFSIVTHYLRLANSNLATVTSQTMVYWGTPSKQSLKKLRTYYENLKYGK